MADMVKHGKIRLQEPEAAPTTEVLRKALGDSYGAYVAFQNSLSDLEITQVWQWYSPHKAWYARGQYKWTTPRGTNKEKTLYWLHVFEGCFDVAVWFLEKNRMELLGADVSNETKKLIREANTFGKLQTFPVVIDVATAEPLADIYKLIGFKKKLEA